MTGSGTPMEGHAHARLTGLVYGGYLLARCECGDQVLIGWEGDLPEWHRKHVADVLAARDKE